MRQSFEIDPKKDADIIKWLAESDDVEAAIRNAIRASILGGLEPIDFVAILLSLQKEVSQLNKAVNQKLLVAVQDLETTEVGEGGIIPENILNNLKGLMV